MDLYNLRVILRNFATNDSIIFYKIYGTEWHGMTSGDNIFVKGSFRSYHISCISSFIGFKFI